MAKGTRRDAAGNLPPGAAYRAKVRLTDKPGTELALPGETCERVPAASLGWLLEQGLIEKVQEAAGG